MRTATNSTRNAINALHARCSFPAIARQLKLDRTYWPVLSRIANGGSVSREVENDVRQALGLPLIERKRFYRPCLSVELGEAIREDRIDLESLLWTVIVAGRQERKKRGV